MIQRRGIEAENDIRNIYKGYFRSRQNVIPEKTDGSSNYNFLPENNPGKADVLYFAGCMTHLTPAIKNSMIKILDASGVNYSFIDEHGGVCCGRPLMLAGQDKEARELINFNSQMILEIRCPHACYIMSDML